MGLLAAGRDLPLLDPVEAPAQAADRQRGAEQQQAGDESGPVAQAAQQGFSGQHRLAGLPATQVVGEFPGGLVTASWLLVQRHLADGSQRGWRAGSNL